MGVPATSLTNPRAANRLIRLADRQLREGVRQFLVGDSLATLTLVATRPTAVDWH